MNSVSILARLAADPELRFTPTGHPVCNLRVAMNKPGDNTSATFLDVTAWDKLAEACAERLVKGQQVAIQGRLDGQEWEAQDGSKRSKILVVANTVDFLAVPAMAGR